MAAACSHTNDCETPGSGCFWNFVLFSIEVLAAKEMVHQELGAAFVTGSPDINKFNQEQILEKLSAPHEIDES